MAKQQKNKAVWVEKPEFSTGLMDLPFAKFCAFSCVAPEGKEINEDGMGYLVLGEDHVLLAVADGVGGQRLGSKASRLALYTVFKSVESRTKKSLSVTEAIQEGILKANRKIINLKVGAATTYSLVEVKGKRLRTYHVGDSLICIYGPRGKLRFQSISHSPVGYAEVSGWMNEDFALRHEERHIVTNVLGIEDLKIEFAQSSRLSKGDIVLMASDGLSDNLKQAEIISCMAEKNLEAVLEKLVTMSRNRMKNLDQAFAKPDDLTVMLFQIQTKVS